MVALYASLRRSDLIRLTRGHVKKGWLIVDIEKTDGHVEIPIHSDLEAELKQKMPVASLMLIPTARGKKMNKDSLSHGVQKECQRLGITPNPPLHGLRRNAIIRLLEAGCSREEGHGDHGSERTHGETLCRKAAQTGLSTKCNSEIGRSDTQPLTKTEHFQCKSV